MTFTPTVRAVPGPWRSARLAPRGNRLLPSVVLWLALFLGLVLMAFSLLSDPDTQWHIEVGRRIWLDRAVPTTDVFSHTFKGAPWIAKEWLSQLILYNAHRLAGWRGIVILAASTIASAFALLHEWLRSRLRPSVALGATLIAIVLAMPHFLARPHMLVLPVIVLWITVLVTNADRRTVPRLPFALVMMLWANMHGSFPLGLVIAGILAAEGIIGASRGERFAVACRWCLFLVASLAVTALSPYGWRAMLVALQMSGNAATLRYVDEWRPLALDATGCLALGLLALVIAALACRLRTNLFRLLAVGLLAYLMIRHARFISLFGIIAPILATRAFACRFALARSHDEPDAERPLPWLWSGAAVLLVSAIVGIGSIDPVPAADVTPDAAFRAAMTAGVSGPVYNDYDFGGFLIAHGVETFVDGRTDQLFLGDFLPDLAKALAAKDDAPFADLLRRHGVRWAIVRTTSPDAGHLARMPGWLRIHTDPVASVFVTRSN